MPPSLMLVSRQSPHAVLLLVVSAILGGVYTFGGAPKPSSVAAVQPGWVLTIWAVAMLISGCVGLYGMFWRRNALRALQLESGAMVLGAAAMLLYSASLFAFAGSRALGSGLTFGFWAGANVWRWWQIRRTAKELE